MTLTAAAAAVGAGAAIACERPRPAEARLRVFINAVDPPSAYDNPALVRVRVADRAGVRWLDGRRFVAFSPALRESGFVAIVPDDTVRLAVYLVRPAGDTVAAARFSLESVPDRAWEVHVFAGGRHPFAD